MAIEEIKTDKKKYLSLLLLGDEEETMIDRYLDRGTMYLLQEDGTAKAVCVVTDEGHGVLEIKNIAVLPQYQRKGYGRQLIHFVVAQHSHKYSVLQVGTGNTPSTLSFYERCGFHRSHVVKNFFTDHYSHPIYENGIQLVDMIYLTQRMP